MTCRFATISLFVLALGVTAAAGCSGGSPQGAPVLPAESANVSETWSEPLADYSDQVLKAQSVYWTLFASCSYPQVQSAIVPIKKTSKNKNFFCSSRNGLHYTSGLAFDSSGRLWIVSFGPSGGSPSEVAVFKLPLKAPPLQQYTFVLSGTNGSDALAFDPKGDLWVTSPGNSSVLEYTGPFTKSGTLSPAITLTASGFNPVGIAFDKSANLYVSNFKSSGTDSIGVLSPPYKSAPYFLNGLTSPGGLAFDKQGNLYASSNGSAPAVVRYNSNDLISGATPSIVDSTGLPASSYEAAFAFTAKGDLYAANCGNGSSAGVDVWPLSTKPFSSSLAPSLLYTNADVTQVGCAWGIAIK